MSDKAAIWFEVLEELGEKPMMTFGEFNKGTNEVRWHELPHKDYDGIGAFYCLVEDLKMDSKKIKFKVSPMRRPNFMQKLKSLFYYHPESKLRHTNWNDFDRNSQVAPLKSCIYFNDEEFKKLKNNAKKHRGTLDSFILFNLDRVIHNNLQPEGEERWWMIPVSMREEGQEYAIENNSSYISVQLNNSNVVRDINTQMIDKLKKFTHWAAWFWMGFLGKFGKKFVKGALEHFDKNNHGWTGIYTSLTYDVLDDYDFFKEHMIIGVAPVTKAHPIAMDTLISNENAVLTLMSHSGLVGELSRLDELLKELKTNLLKD